MNLTIERIILHNFKGLKHENLLLNNSNVTISGANGSGKSTIECGWFWLMADCSESLASNPAVFPLDMEEATPSVEVVAVVDGKHITLERRLTRTVKKSKVEGVADAVSFSSTYLVNSVEYGLRDFKQKIAEYGITDKFLTLSHPDMFLSGKKDEMRKVLFGMVSDITDYEVALQMDGCAEATLLLKDYTFDEVASMQNANLRKIREVYGKDGELLRAKIEGLELSKVDIDFSALELQKNMIKEKLASNQTEQAACEQTERELNELRNRDLALQMELSGIVQKEKTEKKALEEKIYSERKGLQEQLSQIERDISRLNNEVDIHGGAIKRLETSIKQGQDAISKIEAEVFDETTAICPVCHRLYESDKIEEMKNDFEADKLRRIADLHKEITEFMSLLAIKRSESAEISKKIQKAINDKADIETALNKPLNAFGGAMEEPQTYQADKDRLESEIAANNALMESKKAGLKNMTLLKAEELNLHDELRNCEIQLSKAGDNARIDDNIADLRASQMEFEQNKANSEKILYQLSLIQKHKNELLTDSINKHFQIVKFSFFKYQKNGEYKECCEVFVDGKELGASLNTAMQIRAKLDIVSGLQNFFGEHYPVFLDSSEMLDDNTKAQIVMPCQMIYLKVADNKELFVKEG